MTETRPHHEIIGAGDAVGELLLDIRAGVEDRTEMSEEEFSGGASFDPRSEAKRPAFERSGYTPRECSFHEIMELFAVHERGPLSRPLQRPVKGEAYGEDDARRAWEWVTKTKGWNSVIHEVMRHLEVRQKTWDEWPRASRVVNDAAGCDWCPWPFVTLEIAQAAWLPFFRELRRRYREQPFTVKEQTVEFS